MFELTKKRANGQQRLTHELHRLKVEYEKLHTIYIVILRKLKPGLIDEALWREVTAHRINAYANEGGSPKTINNYVGMTITHKPKEEEQEQEERYSCWCFLTVGKTGFEAKIIHKGRGKFKILNDEYGGKYTNKITYASDVIRCL